MTQGKGGSRGREAAKDSSPARSESYLRLSTRPLHVLVFLAPLVLAYEVGSILFLTDRGAGVVETIKAHRLLSDFFGLFGVTGFYLPGAALIVVLFVWHVIRRDPWRIRGWALVGMLAESALWSAPLLALSRLFQDLTPPAGGAAAALVQETAQGLSRLTAPARATIAIGAGLYEELLFRMLAIAAFHLILVDLFRAREINGRIGSVALAALAFALYHDAALAGGPDWGRLAFYFAAGMYFGGLYAWRGFGVVVGAHALYDVAALLIRV